jgi:hypothetical protein
MDTSLNIDLGHLAFNLLFGISDVKEAIEFADKKIGELVDPPFVLLEISTYQKKGITELYRFIINNVETSYIDQGLLQSLKDFIRRIESNSVSVTEAIKKIHSEIKNEDINEKFQDSITNLNEEVCLKEDGVMHFSNVELLSELKAAVKELSN